MHDPKVLEEFEVSDSCRRTFRLPSGRIIVLFGDDSFRLHPVRRHFEVCSSGAMIHVPFRFEFHALRGLLPTRYLGMYAGHSAELLMLLMSRRRRHHNSV